MTKVNLIAKLPALISEDDYHGFPVLQNHLNTIFHNRFVVEQIGCDERGYYIAMVYAGRRPSRATIQKLKAKAGIEEDY